MDFYNATGGPTTWLKRCHRTDDATCWGSDSYFCNWFGIGCRISNGNIAFISINLPANNLTGALPASLARFCGLTALVVPDNAIGGPPPPFGSVTDMPNLTTLDLSSNWLIGALPEDYGYLSALSYLSLASNSLYGPIPESLKCASALVTLVLSDNSFSGGMPELFDPSRIRYVDVSLNELSGPLPQRWNVSNAARTLWLSFAENQFTGMIPESLCKIPILSRLVLSYNRLEGPIPQALTQGEGLQIVLLDNNHLSGTIPPFSGYSSIVMMDFSNNVLMEGTIGADLVRYNNALVYLSIKGNVKMHLESNSNLSSIIWWGADYSNMDVDDGRIFYCPTVETVPPYYFQLSASPEFLGYSVCTCARGYYGLPPDECQMCPPHGNCSQGGTTVTWKRGFYPVFNGSLLLLALPCGDYGTDGSTSGCNPYNNCSLTYGSDVSCALCSPGSEGRLCSRCMCPMAGSSDVCYFSSRGRCLRCDLTLTVVVATILGVAVIALALFLAYLFVFRNRFYVKIRRVGAIILDSGTLKILLVFVQTTASLNGLWPEWAMANGMRWLNISNLSTSGTGVECVFHFMNDPVLNLLAYLLVLPALTGLIAALVLLRAGIAWLRRRSGDTSSATSSAVPSPAINRSADVASELVGHELTPEASDVREPSDAPAAPPHDESLPLLLSSSASKAERQPLLQAQPGSHQLEAAAAADDEWQPRPWHWGIYAWMYLLYFLYFELANRTLAVFNCVAEPVTGDKYLSMLPWLRCSSDTQWSTLAKMGIASSAVYVAGIPLLFAALLLAFRRHSHERRVKYWLGNLYYCYRPSMYWFELAMLTRRLLLAILISVTPQSTPFRAAAIILVLWVALVVQHLVRPFAVERDNRLEELAIGTVLFTFVTQTLWRAYSQLHSVAQEKLAVSWSAASDVLVIADGYALLLVSLVLVLNVVMLVVVFGCMVWPLVVLFYHKIARWWHRRRQQRVAIQ